MCVRIVVLFCICNLLFIDNSSSQGCTGLKANAGPDLFTCDPTMALQLMGSFNGMPTKYFWTPTTYLSDPNALDPIVNAPPGKYKYTFNVEAISTTNLIVNGDFESGNSGFTHDYNYGMPGGPFSPGWLSVGTNPFAYNSGFSPCGDHTSGTGNQLIVDGSTVPNSNVWCQTVSVTAGKMYLFRFYVQTIFPVSPGHLIALANGVTIGDVQAGGLCDWQTLEVCFTATSSTVKMCIVETTLVAFGNDFAIDDIQMYEKCMDKDDVDIEIVDLKSKLQVAQPPKCASDIFDLNAIGSSAGPNITYEWRTEGGKIVSENGLSAKGQGSGKYFIKVIYQNGTNHCEKEAEVDITASEDIQGTLEVSGIADCNLDTVFLKAKALTGSGNISYQWVPGNKILRGQNDSIAYVTDAGIYKVVIIDLNSGCKTEVQDVVVSDTVKPNLQITGDSLLSCKINSALFLGNPFDTTKYSYEWLLPDSSKLKNKDSIISKIAGTFSLKIIDKINKCSTDKFWSIKIDTLKPNIDLGPDQIIDCINTNIDITPIGNNPNANINYYWTLPSGTLALETSLKNKQENKQGLVILKVSNSINGCEFSDTMSIKDIRKIPMVDIGNGTTLNCKIKDWVLDATKTIVDSSMYSWSTINGNFLAGKNTLSPLVNAAGWYYLHLEDTINHCKNIDSVFIDQNIITPKSILGPDLVFTCADTILTIDGSNSSKGSQLKYVWFSPNGNITQGQGTSIIKIKAAGDYFLIVQDSINFCVDTATIHVKPDLNAPMAAILVKDTLTCSTPSVVLFGTANSPSADPLKYNWTSSAGQKIQNPNSLTPNVSEAGEYILTVIDQTNGCSNIVKAIVNIDTIKPTAIIDSANTWYCNTIKLTLDGSNSSGNHKLQFQWTSPDGSILSNAQNANIDIGAPGTYALKVIDLFNGCESTYQTIVQKDLNIPLAIIQTPDTLTCIKLNITIDAQGSSSGNRIFYDWNTKDGRIIGAKDQIKLVVDKPGSYQLFILDTINHCNQQQTVQVIQDIQAPIIDAGNTAELLCQNLDLTISGNIISKGNNKIQWKTNQGNIISQSDSLQIKINKPGFYYFEVTNVSNGCVAQDSVLITTRNNILVDAGLSAEINCQISDATLSGSIQNNAGNLQFNWTTNQGHFIGNTNTIQVKVDRPGWYYFNATNAITGCNGTDSVLVSKINNLVVDAGIATELTCTVKDATLTGSLQNNAGNETLQWTTNQGHFIGNTNTSQAKADQPGWYYFVVTNVITACNGIDSVLITENTNIPSAISLEVDQPKCPGDSWQTDITNITGGEKPIQVFLENQLINGLIMQGTNPGNYSIKVIDKNGCELSDNFIIINPSGVSVQLIPFVKLSLGDNYNLIPMYSIPDDSIASVDWSPAEFLSCTNCLYPLIKGIKKDIEYTVMYTNRNGCIATASIKIEIIKRNIWIPNVFSPNGDNINDHFYPFVTEDSYKEIKSMQIFDRWGNLLFIREHFPPNDPNFGWNGDSNNEHLNPATFVYVIEVEWKNGETEKRFGDVTLIR